MITDEAQAIWTSQTSSAFRLSPEDMGVRVAVLESRLRRRFRLMYAVCAFEIVAFVIILVAFPGTLERVGALLTIAAMTFLIIQVRIHALRTAWSAIGVMSAVLPSAEFYRDFLARQRDFHRGRWLWSRLVAIAPGPFIFMFALARDYPDSRLLACLEIVAFFLLLLYAMRRQSREAQRYQARIDALRRLGEDR